MRTRTMTIAEMKQRKAELGYSNEQLALLSGVPLSTVQKIFSGTTKTPRHQTLEALEAILKVKPGYNYNFDTDASTNVNASRICEAVQPYYIPKRKQGEYTVEDYRALPDERRVELIDGVIYDMSAPTTIHQIVQLEVALRLRMHIAAKGGDCIAMMAPTDVQIDMDEFTMVQPDVFVVCDRNKFTRPCIFGVPDLIIEILSPSTKNKDTYIKGKKYKESGVREYWLVDPDKLKIMVYDFTNEEESHIPRIYGFTDEVPVSIFDGECVIDFKEIYEAFRFILDTTSK